MMELINWIRRLQIANVSFTTQSADKIAQDRIFEHHSSNNHRNWLPHHWLNYISTWKTILYWLRPLCGCYAPVWWMHHHHHAHDVFTTPDHDFVLFHSFRSKAEVFISGLISHRRPQCFLVPFHILWNPSCRTCALSPLRLNIPLICPLRLNIPLICGHRTAQAVQSSASRLLRNTISKISVLSHLPARIQNQMILRY